MFKKLNDKLANYKRVLSVAKKPTLDDMKTVIRVCGMGIALIGSIGFFFFIVFALLGAY
ncbi:MAG TPA: protein translocase SEC61 complex subunit gamma [archaeon]|nr:protein translocase SEC61 complex subunit gamma [archaeon]